MILALLIILFIILLIIFILRFYYGYKKIKNDILDKPPLNGGASCEVKSDKINSLNECFKTDSLNKCFKTDSLKHLFKTDSLNKCFKESELESDLNKALSLNAFFNSSLDSTFDSSFDSTFEESKESKRESNKESNLNKNPNEMPNNILLDDSYLNPYLEQLLKDNEIFSREPVHLSLEPFKKDLEFYDVLVRKSKNQVQNLIEKKLSAEIEVQHVGNLKLKFGEDQLDSISISNWWEE